MVRPRLVADVAEELLQPAARAGVDRSRSAALRAARERRAARRWQGGWPQPCGPPRDPRNRFFSGPEAWHCAFLLTLVLRGAGRHRRLRRRGAGAGCCLLERVALAGSGFTMSMLPLKYAPSSMMMRAVLMSPTSLASLRISILSVASTLPWIVPSTTTSRALTVACTVPFGPMVSLCSRASTVPSTSPST